VSQTQYIHAKRFDVILVFVGHVGRIIIAIHLRYIYTEGHLKLLKFEN